MRAKLIITAIIVQFLALGWMAGSREWILRTGPTVWLRTAPVDPRDPFRGDYLTLGYEISTIPAAKFGPGLHRQLADLAKRHADHPHHARAPEIVLYTALQVDPATGVAEVATVDLTPPAAGLFIKGRVRPTWDGQGNPTNLTRIAYGIDAYFVQQGKGKELERRAPTGTPAGVLVPMEMQVALSHSGTAVLKDQRWGPLGIGVRIQDQKTSAQAATATPAHPKIIRVTLYNASQAPLAVVLPPDLRTLRIQRMDNWNGPGTDASSPPLNPPPLTDADVRLLQPAESATADIDPARPEWFVQATPDTPPAPLWQQADRYLTLRVMYQPPPAVACRALSAAERIAPGPLVGGRFDSYELKPK